MVIMVIRAIRVTLDNREVGEVIKDSLRPECESTVHEELDCHPVAMGRTGHAI